MARYLARCLVLLALVAAACGQMCTPKRGVLKLVGVDTCRDSLGLIECLGKVQLSVSDFCTVQLIPDIKVALDGTFCELSNGVQRGSVFGRLSLGQSHLDFEFKNAPQPGMVGMNVRGRVVPSEGGMEKQVDCNFLYNVTAGQALGVVSQGSDSMAIAGGYSGLQLMPGQQVAGGAVRPGYAREATNGAAAALPAVAKLIAALMGALALLLI